MMDMNRNHWFLVGVVVLLLGVQFRIADTFVLTPEFTQFLAERTGHPLASVNAATQSWTASEKPLAKKPVHPPEWLGWFLGSIGMVCILH
ncbi:hypothetical protein LCGC14_3079120, partial [marine sediment metagenome]